MQAYLVSDHEPISATIRPILLRDGLACPSANVLTLDLAAYHLAQAEFDLVVVVLSPDPERALAVMGQLREKAAGRILVVGPSADPKLLIRALRGGAHDYVDDVDVEEELGVALARWRSGRPTPQGEAGRLISVLAPSGGSGSSTLAANVATVLAKQHESAALIDLKLEAGDLAALLDLKPTYTMADFCQNIQRMDRALFERTLVRHASGVHLLASPRVYADVALVNPEGVGQALTLARAAFPYVVADLDHSFRGEQMQALRLSDLILLVLRLDFASLRNTRRTLDHLEREGIERDRLRLVVNRFGQPKEVPAAKAEEALGLKIHHFVPDDPRAVNRANNNGVPVVLEAPSARVSRSVTRLAISVNGLHKKDH